MSEKEAIVIVEHDRALRVMYRAILTGLRIKNPVLFFDNGSEVIRYLEKSAGDFLFILSNANLPRMKGWELKKKINELNVGASATPFIILCEDCNESDVAGAKALGVDAVLTGNDHYQTLQQHLEQLIEAREKMLVI